jgi:hypothetical protein
MIICTNAIIEPRAMMVKHKDASSTGLTMFGAIRLEDLAVRADF